MNGERLKRARKRAGLSLRGLAEKLDGAVSAQAIGKYERGEMLPTSGVLAALAKALDVSLSYLLASGDIELSGVEFRTKAGTGARDRARVETEVLEWVERYLQIEEILELDSGGWSCPEGMPRRLEGFEDAERLADDLRSAWQLGIDPIPNMTQLLEERRIKVLVERLPQKMSGLTCLVRRGEERGEVPVIVVNRDQSVERRRFSLAHELGHRVIASGCEGDMEKLCRRFAGAFLVNREHVLKEVGEKRSAIGVREILNLKRLYGVSAAAFLMRLEQVGILDRSGMEYAFGTYGRRWRSQEPEPLEDEEAERPQRFESLVYRAAAEDLISLSKAAELLRVPITEIERGLKGPAEAYAGRR